MGTWILHISATKHTFILLNILILLNLTSRNPKYNQGPRISLATSTHLELWFYTLTTTSQSTPLSFSKGTLQPLCSTTFTNITGKLRYNFPFHGIKEQRTRVWSLGKRELEITLPHQVLHEVCLEKSLFFNLKLPLTTIILYNTLTFSWWSPLLKCTSITWKRKHICLLGL